MSTWTEVNHLIQELETIRGAARHVGGADDARASLDHAVVIAAEAINFAIDSPGNPDRLLVARDALQACTVMLLALDRERTRSLQARRQGDSFRRRALELVGALRAYVGRPPDLY